MRILIVGGSGMIGSEVVKVLTSGNEVIQASRSHGAIKVDITDPGSIRAMYKSVGKVDAIISAAGSGAWKPLGELTDEDFESSLKNKLMGQANLVRYGFDSVTDHGSITVTSGVLSQKPMVGSGAISLLNSGLEGFVRAAALEAPRGIRVNVISPPWVSETLKLWGQDPSHGMPAATVARSYVDSVKGKQTGTVIEPK
jgi:NAD(P)-dependent dehydrogenase (short-subunit alcohol dehydrogenase family)